ncbi:hypothetical protein CW304_11840 [Bacillus sp. UFRGS-B20]|nr:hypothetical protein CW304_11840 [Bacillus sp. UFRGS-B20]
MPTNQSNRIPIYVLLNNASSSYHHYVYRRNLCFPLTTPVHGNNSFQMKRKKLRRQLLHSSPFRKRFYLIVIKEEETIECFFARYRWWKMYLLNEP